MKLFIRAFGPSKSGKSYILNELVIFLQERGFTVSDVVEKPNFNEPNEKVFVEGIFAEKIRN